jgi:hypothetical protein
MHGWAPEVIGAVGEPEPNPQGYIDVFFAHTDSSREPAGRSPAGSSAANGDSDPIKIYPDAAQGFLFQRHAEFAADVHAFLRS